VADLDVLLTEAMAGDQPSARPGFEAIVLLNRRRRRRRRGLQAVALFSGAALVLGGAAVAKGGSDKQRAIVTSEPDGPEPITVPGRYAVIFRDRSNDHVGQVIPVVDVRATRLSRLAVEGGDLVSAGLVEAGRACVVVFGPINGGGGGCGPKGSPGGETVPGELQVGIGGGLDPDSAQISGSGPVGTVRVTVEAVGKTTLVLTPYDAGSDWAHRAFFAFPWRNTPTDLTAFDAAGKVLSRLHVSGY
jgi:hypothetical protein